jgi:group I intron endonuclease
MAQKIWSLYRITNLINNKIYIGQTVNYRHRWLTHCRAVTLNKPTQIIHHAMIKHGLDNFVFEVIASCISQEDTNYIETQLVQQYDSYITTGKGYNITLGGMNAPKTEAFKQMISNYWADPTYKAKVSENISKSYQNKTPEEKEKLARSLSDILAGRHLSPDTEYKVGHSFDESTLKKMSEIKKGKHASVKTEFKPGHKIRFTPTPEEKEKWRNKLSIKSKNKHYSPATEIKPGQRVSIRTEFKPTIDWPCDQDLIEQINQSSMTIVAKQLMLAKELQEED